MCLAIPGRVQEVDDVAQTALIDYKGLMKSASTRLQPDVAAGDYVLVHAGFIIQLLPPEDGEELTALAEEVGFYD